MTLDQVYAIFELAGLKESIRGVTQITNEYWPNHPNYDQVRNENPWYSVSLTFGTVVIGWRKRVINISWKDSKYRGEITSDDVTKSDTHVHAYRLGDAVKYLSNLQSLPVVEGPGAVVKEYRSVGREQVLKDLNVVFDVRTDFKRDGAEHAVVEAFVTALPDDDVVLTWTSVDDRFSAANIVSLKAGKFELKLHP